MPPSLPPTTRWVGTPSFRRFLSKVYCLLAGEPLCGRVPPASGRRGGSPYKSTSQRGGLPVRPHWRDYPTSARQTPPFQGFLTSNHTSSWTTAGWVPTLASHHTCPWGCVQGNWTIPHWYLGGHRPINLSPFLPMPPPLTACTISSETP